ncbi:MAG: hypothetical protein E5V72_02215 [Mesorhizobium sp.]|uniref:hypothetical protein n=1 Tax=Mesorhizobium sp. TaxID=1871066 RepID=UPI000FE4ECF9|nr:hypothetical protein [Mesorhizobium sp.]RWH50250.1 MAG: hypothetical protein EOQ80_04575 [Mesorhizobium sp.]RWH52284.1 MAG: hypothetical protein EOQ82_26670 [Mesorhizobium sp.]RWI69683.1 MAG: hypothetical protein EOR18_20865 [Mesorhizobium sp.]RWI76150.1 MAG: hypothetical protein EOR19_18455 [Mesorhizobium sp.]RWJ33220.1 MAG: hypothetical protein EOR28_11585 [Mesorhizobium sp.]
MTPKQKELLVRALITDRLYPQAGEYTTLKAMRRRGWTTQEWSIGRETVTLEGIEALEANSKPIEIFQANFRHLLLIKGQPVAEVLPGQRQKMEKLLADTGL